MTDKTHREAFERFKLDVAERICSIEPPASISDLRKEYWKAGARRVIHEVNLALDAAHLARQSEWPSEADAARVWNALSECCGENDFPSLDDVLAALQSVRPPAQPAQAVNVVVKPTQRCKLCHPETCACPDYRVVVNGDVWTTGDLEHCNEIARKVRALTIASRHTHAKD